MSSKSRRHGKVHRKTNETDLTVEVLLDGQGTFSGSVGIPFLEHMLALLARHALVDLTISGTGDLAVDDHHTTEDLGITLGQAVREALGDRQGIRRYGEAYVPMEECLARCVLDLCNRPYFVFQAAIPRTKVGTFDAELGEEFLRAFAINVGATVHLDMLRNGNVHHGLEALFKATGRALGQAISIDPRIQGVMSTKGIIS
jgi:imidazoleglycerol-phosphate dehydratase